MLRLSVVGAFVVALLAASSSAIGDANCKVAYSNYSKRLAARDITTEQRSTLQKWASRAYRACESGDVEDITKLLDGLDKHLAPS